VLAGLEHAGLSPGAYQVVEIPFPQMPDALLNNQVDVVYAVDPFSTILVKSGKVEDLGSATYSIHPNLRIAAHVASQRMVTQNPELLRRWRRAYNRSMEYVMENRSRHGEWQVKYFRLKPELKDQVGNDARFEDADMGPEFVASLVKTKNFMLKYKFLNMDVDPGALIFR
jgi:NitT/TauT family transport system substrate-binding protein